MKVSRVLFWSSSKELETRLSKWEWAGGGGEKKKTRNEGPSRGKYMGGGGGKKM